MLTKYCTLIHQFPALIFLEMKRIFTYNHLLLNIINTWGSFVCELHRLQQLEQEVVGGEQARNKELQQRHRQRKKAADQRKRQLLEALSENGEDSENVLLSVYNSIQEEVYAKSQILAKVQGKVGCLAVTCWRFTLTQ